MPFGACIAFPTDMLPRSAAMTRSPFFSSVQPRSACSRLILARLIHLIDHHHIHRRFGHSHFEPELLLHGGEEVRRRVGVRRGWWGIGRRPTTEAAPL